MLIISEDVYWFWKVPKLCRNEIHEMSQTGDAKVSLSLWGLHLGWWELA